MKRAATITFAILTALGIYGGARLAWDGPALLEAHDRALIEQTVREVLGRLRDCQEKKP